MSSQGRNGSSSSDGFQMTRRALGRSMALTTLGAWLLPDAAGALQLQARPRASADDLQRLIRIGSNENPYGIGPAAADAVRRTMAVANRYPYEMSATLADAVAKFHDVSPEWIALSPGSGDVLRAATMTFTSPSLPLLSAAPTFETPAQVAERFGVPVRAPQVTADGRLDLKAMAAQAAGVGLIYICNPNNPTGSIVSASAVKEFVAAVRKVNPDAFILIDEAYADLVDDPSYGTATTLIDSDHRVFVSRTFSKIHGMAGLRVGYAIAHPETLALLRRNLTMGTLAATSIAAAMASLADTENLKKQKTLNRETRAITRRAFEKAGYTVLPSEANFLMVDIKRDSREYQNTCRQSGIVIARPFPPLNTFARITIGTAEEMQKATPLLLSLLQSSPHPTSPQAAAHAQPDFDMPGYPASC